MNLEAMVGVMIPFFGIVLGVALVMMAIYLDFRRKREMFQLHHAERMAAIEKGIELPPLPEEFFRRRRDSTGMRRSGLILVFIGIAITLALWGSAGSAFWWGLVPVGIGLAFILAALLEIREDRERRGSTRSDAPTAGGQPGNRM